MKRISFYIVIVLLGVSFFTSCEEQGLLTHTNDVSYIAFEKNMTTDTTGVSFKFYNEGENAKILLGVTLQPLMRRSRSFWDLRRLRTSRTRRFGRIAAKRF